MRRLSRFALGFTLTAGLAMTSAVADNANSQPAVPADTALATKPSQPAMPAFLRKLLEHAGVIQPEPAVHPWLAWWLETFRIDPRDQPTTSATAAAKPDAPQSTSSTTASR